MALWESWTQKATEIKKPLRIYGIQGTEVKLIPSLQPHWDGVPFTWTGSLHLRCILTQLFMTHFPEIWSDRSAPIIHNDTPVSSMITEDVSADWFRWQLTLQQSRVKEHKIHPLFGVFLVIKSTLKENSGSK